MYWLPIYIWDWLAKLNVSNVYWTFVREKHHASLCRRAYPGNVRFRFPYLHCTFYISICISTLPTQHTTFITYNNCAKFVICRGIRATFKVGVCGRFNYCYLSSGFIGHMDDNKWRYIATDLWEHRIERFWGEPLGIKCLHEKENDIRQVFC